MADEFRRRRKRFEFMWVRATSQEQMLMKRKKVDTMCNAAANSINRSKNASDLRQREKPILLRYEVMFAVRSTSCQVILE